MGVFGDDVCRCRRCVAVEKADPDERPQVWECAPVVDLREILSTAREMCAPLPAEFFPDREERTLPMIWWV